MNLTNEQIQFIRDDIFNHGITIEGLRDDLVDHICCLLEQHPGEAGEFHNVYREILGTFYKKELKEIETETIRTLNQKTTAMKKSMMITGLFAAGLMSLGIVLKFMHAPGAGTAIVSGTFLFSLFFLPLLGLVRMREKQVSREKLLIVLGVLAAIPMSLSFVFRIQHWQGAMIMLYLAIGIALLLFLPVYLAGGFRRPETKMQTVIVTVLLVTGCGLWLSLVASPSAVRRDDAKNMQDYRLSEQILKTELAQADKAKSLDPEGSLQERSLYNRCEDFKSAVFSFATRTSSPANDQLREEWLDSFFAAHPEAAQEVHDLKSSVDAYNKSLSHGMNSIPGEIFQEIQNVKTVEALHEIVQVQMMLLQNERI